MRGQTIRGRLASGLSTRPPGSILSLWASPLHDSLVITMFICVLVCANVILCRYPLGPLALLDLMVSLMSTSSKQGVRSDHQVFQPCLVGESSAALYR